MVASPGFEPGRPESESGLLPVRVRGIGSESRIRTGIAGVKVLRPTFGRSRCMAGQAGLEPAWPCGGGLTIRWGYHFPTVHRAYGKPQVYRPLVFRFGDGCSAIELEAYILCQPRDSNPYPFRLKRNGSAFGLRWRGAAPRSRTEN